MNGAAFARLVGASPGQLHDWETGKQPLTIRKAVQIERALEITGLVDAVIADRRSKAVAA